MKIRKIIYADAGKVLTNGKIYRKQIFLAEGVSETDFHEITEEEYESITAEQEEIRRAINAV